jgi:opacity protein-like surface antigen
VGGFVLAPATHADEIDTDHLFSFNAGTDTGDPGKKEIQASLAGGLGRSGGSYSALKGELSFQYTPVRDLVLGLSAPLTYHGIDNVPGMENRSAAAFGGMAFSLAYRLLDRVATGLGVAVSAEPHWVRVDDNTGEPINGYGVGFVLAADKELIPARLVGVINLGYEPEAARSRLADNWSRENAMGLGGGLMLKLRDNVFAGIEARYLRRYETLDFSAFSGQAFFLGPNISMTLSERSWLTVGWSAQIAGHTADGSGALDLVNFNRHEVRVAFGTKF